MLSYKSHFLPIFEWKELDLIFPFTLLVQLHNDRYLTGSHKFKISGQGVTEEPKGVFTINSRTGEIRIHLPIDRELYPTLQVSHRLLISIRSFWKFNCNELCFNKALLSNLSVTRWSWMCWTRIMSCLTKPCIWTWS